MKTFGLTVAAGLLLALTASRSEAQITISNPYNGQGVTIGANGVTPTYGYNNGYNNYGAYGAPGANYYNSGYRAPGVMPQNGYYNGNMYPGVMPQNGYYNGNMYPGYGGTVYRYPVNTGRGYTYPGTTTTYRRGMFRRMRAR